MKVFIFIFLLLNSAYASMDSYLYTSTYGEMSYDLVARERYGDIELKVDNSLSPIWAGIAGDIVYSAAPFLSLSAGSQLNIGWNYHPLGIVELVGLGLNKRADADDQDDGVNGWGLDGVAYNIHVGGTLQYAWNRFIAQIYNELNYFAYTRAEGDDLWYYLGDEGMNQNTFNHRFTTFIGYTMPEKLDLVGVEFSGRLPLYNAESGSGSVREIGYKMDISLMANYKFNDRWSLMTILKFSNGLEDPITSEYERTWGFDRVQFVFAWRM
ncbi:MAG: hypothetical protein LBV09_00975 [Deferribacteraceae bacterium]|jgi:hypothetical protein|nr:hypothetical protein [Deferribacteraceae bacterium]